MALDPVVNQLREIAISGSATLADIPFLAQRLKQGQTGQFGQTSPGLPSEEAGRGGPGLGAGLFEPPPAPDISAGGGGGGEPVQLPSFDTFGEAFASEGRPPNFGGRAGGDTADTGTATTDSFSDFSEAVAAALSGPFGILGLPAKAVFDAISDLSASRDLAADLDFSDLQGLRDLDISLGDVADEGSPGGGAGSGAAAGSPGGVGGAGQSGVGSGAGGAPGGPGTGGSPGTAGGGGDGGGGGGGSGGGGSGDGGPGGGAGEGRHVGGIVSEDERPGITAGDVPNQLLQEGEFIVRREAVQNIGEPFMDALNILAANFSPKQTRNALRELLK